MASMNVLPPTDLLSAMNPKPTALTANDTTEAQDRFMTLLVTQMKNQDPLNPLDNAQVTGQLAQLSTVNGIHKLNDTMLAMVQSVQGNQAMQAAALIGRQVMVPGSSLVLSDGSVTFGAELATSADRLQLTINDASGTPVRSIDLGAAESGLQTLVWDGMTSSGDVAPKGRYQFQLSATRGGQPVNVQPLVMEQVASVLASAGLPVSLRTRSGRADVKLSEIRQIL